eukprot:scaffold20868_cov79-Isochrysis_galbana.AAC.2
MGEGAGLARRSWGGLVRAKRCRHGQGGGGRGTGCGEKLAGVCGAWVCATSHSAAAQRIATPPS